MITIPACAPIKLHFAKESPRNDLDGQGCTHWGLQYVLDKQPTDKMWKNILTAEEYNVMRKGQSERPASSPYVGFFPNQGYFACKACGLSLYEADTKFYADASHPAFGKSVEGHVKCNKNKAVRNGKTEAFCVQCDSHLGEVTKESNPSKFNVGEVFEEKHTINGVALMYVNSAKRRQSATVDFGLV